MKARRISARWTGLVGLFALIAMVAPSVSSAKFAIVPGSLELRVIDNKGDPDTRVGAHPDRVLVDFELESEGTGPRDLMFDYGPGLTGSPTATPICPRAVFENEECPGVTRVGLFTLDLGGSSFGQPLFNVAPAPNQIAALGSKPLWQTEFGMSLRPTDYGLSISTTDMAEFPITAGEVELWGIPADHVGGERVPLLTTPTECGPLSVVFRTRSWEVGAPWLSETAQTVPFTGCESLPFEPHLDLQLSDPIADSPTGATIDLSMTQHNDPDGQVGSNLEEVRVDLPPGMTVSPGGVEEMEVCRDAQLGVGTESPVTCPLRSRVGTIEISTPQLGETLSGPVFLGEERPGERFRLFVVAEAPGLHFKSVAKLLTDPQTGQLSTVLSNLPQASLSHISLRFDGGPNAVLATPLSCGPASAQAQFTPYGSHEVGDSSSPTDVQARPGSTCPGAPAFSPGLVAGSTQVKAGKNTGFSFTLTRHDGEQLTKKFSAALPSGLNADLTTVDLCPDSAAEAGLCPANSRIGSAAAAVGSGESTAVVSGDVYLTEPYRGAPFGLSIVFDASIGPFQLGALDVRGVLRLDPRTGQLMLETDSLPLIFEGVALRFRTIGIDLDRPGFLFNPTSCKPAQIVSSIHAVDGRVTSVANPFNIRGCEALGFRPKFSLAVEGRSGGRGEGNPKLSIGVRTRRGDANLRRFEVEFPRLLAFHSGGVRAVCARGDAIEGLCPAGSRVGTGIANTPLLDEPLRGPVYLVQPKGNGFPDFWSSLEGMGVEMQLIGESFRRDGRLITELVDLPDVPLSTFTMKMNGGKNGLFSLKGDPCKRGRARASRGPVELEAQDGAHRELQVQLRAGCAASGHRKKSLGRRSPDRPR